MKERRLLVRYLYRCQVTVRAGGGQPFDAETTEIALTGAGLLMTSAAVAALAQGGAILTPGDRLEVWLPAMEEGASTAAPALAGRVRHVRRLSQRQYHVGLWFEGLDGAAEAALGELVALAGGG